MQPDKFVYKLPADAEIVVTREGKVFLMLPDTDRGFGMEEHDMTDSSLGQILLKQHQPSRPLSPGVH
jgi:hypothetical protein